MVAAQLLEAGHQVAVLDNLSTGRADTVPVGAETFVGDLSDHAVLNQALRGVDAVLHFAASIQVGESMQWPLRHFRNNAGATMILLEAMVDHGVGRFVFSSTAALYGQPEQIPVPEGHALRPANPYGESKLMVESMLAWLNRCNGLRYASLRYFNAAGGALRSGAVNLIPIILEVALGLRPHITIFGTDYPTRDGTAVRDYIHIEDLATAHLLALSALETRSRLIYNLGNGVGFTVREVIAVARKVTGHPIPVVEAARRDGDPAEMIASSELIRRELGWIPRFPDLESIVESAWSNREAINAGRHQGSGPK